MIRARDFESKGIEELALMKVMRDVQKKKKRNMNTHYKSFKEYIPPHWNLTMKNLYKNSLLHSPATSVAPVQLEPKSNHDTSTITYAKHINNPRG